MKITRCIITTLIVHLVSAITIAFATTDIRYAMPTGVMFAIFGVFYLIIEAPLILIAQVFLDQLSSRRSLLMSGIGVSFVGAVFGYLICFKEGGSRPDEYARGFGVAGGIGGLLILLSVMMWPLAKIKSGQNAVEQPATAPQSKSK